MVWMIPAAMLGSAAISGGMGMFGASQNANAAAQANQLAALNYAMQRDAITKQLRMSQAGEVNSRGGRRFYDEGSNTWMTMPSEMEATLQGASDREQLKGLTQDASLRRQQLQRNFANASQEQGLANVFFDRMRRGAYDTGADSQSGRYIMDALRAENEGSNEANDGMAMQALRTGNVNSVRDALMSRAGGGRTASTLRDARREGAAMGNEFAANNQNRDMSAYSGLTGRNIDMGQMPYSQVATQNDALLDAMRKSSMTGGAYGTNALASLKTPGAADNGMTQMGQIGQGFSSFLQNWFKQNGGMFGGAVDFGGSERLLGNVDNKLSSEMGAFNTGFRG